MPAQPEKRPRNLALVGNERDEITESCRDDYYSSIAGLFHVFWHWPVATFQILHVRSIEPEMHRSPV